MKLSILRVLLIITVTFSLSSCSGGNTSTYEDYANIINDSDDVTIYFYGDEIKFDYEFKILQVNNISEVKTENSINYLIINLSESDFDLTQEDLTLLEELIEESQLVVLYSGFSIYSNDILDSGLNLYYANESFDDVEIYLYDPANSFSVSTSENGGFYIIDFIVYHLRGTN